MHTRTDGRTIVGLLVVLTVGGACRAGAQAIAEKTAANSAPMAATKPVKTKQETLSESPGRRRFYVVQEDNRNGADVKAYCESLIARVPTARIVARAEQADYLVYPSVRYTSRDVIYQFPSIAGDVIFEEEEKLVTLLECRFARVGLDGKSAEVLKVEGESSRVFRGATHIVPSVESTDVIDAPPTPKLKRAAALKGNGAEKAVEKAVYDLCNVQARVIDVDAAHNRLLVAIGKELGVTGKNRLGTGSEMTLFAVTARLPLYTFQDRETGGLYRAERGSTEAHPDNQEEWIFRTVESVRGEAYEIRQGTGGGKLIPLGERVGAWAEVQEVGETNCIVALKRKVDFNATIDDRQALANLPDFRAVPLIARVRVKRRYLRD